MSPYDFAPPRHLSVDLQSALNTGASKSCGTLFSILYRNLVSHSLFNRDITGAEGSRIQARSKEERPGYPMKLGLGGTEELCSA
jgi:hypothetical protein